MVFFKWYMTKALHSTYFRPRPLSVWNYDIIFKSDTLFHSLNSLKVIIPISHQFGFCYISKIMFIVCNKLLIKLISQPLSGTSFYKFCKTLYTKYHATVENCLQNSKPLISLIPINSKIKPFLFSLFKTSEIHHNKKIGSKSGSRAISILDGLSSIFRWCRTKLNQKFKSSIQAVSYLKYWVNANVVAKRFSSTLSSIRFRSSG